MTLAYPAEPSSVSSGHVSGPPCDRIVVLILDEDDAFRHGLAEHLRCDGHPVSEYATPAHLPAVSALAEPGLLIVDDRAALNSGLQWARRFHEACCRNVTIVVTAQANAQLEGVLRELPFVSLCAKPLDYFAFHAFLHETLAARQG